MLPQQFFATVAEQAFNAVVDEGEAAVDIQRVNEVGRAVDQKAMPLFRLLQALQDVVVFPLQPPLLSVLSMRRSNSSGS